MESTVHLQQAFKRTSLASMGYTLETALNTPAIAICLKRLAAIQASKTQPAPKREYWFNNI